MPASNVLGRAPLSTMRALRSLDKVFFLQDYFAAATRRDPRESHSNAIPPVPHRGANEVQLTPHHWPRLPRVISRRCPLKGRKKHLSRRLPSFLQQQQRHCAPHGAAFRQLQNPK
ncbi:hypothetical protein TRVL_08723 [Trypanosoma vivax]|nr:hypothetical protein TRVL_08723 [Trypanosoma vivax]